MRKRTKDPKESWYERLTPRQKEYFDLYVIKRSLNAVAKAMGTDMRTCKGVFNSAGFQKALKEANDEMKDASAYNEAVIIDRLWTEYNKSDTPSATRVQIIVLLGKHIGMWSNISKQDQKAKVSHTYNVINYNEIKEEIKKNEEAVEKARHEPMDIPDGVTITEYPDTVQ